MDSTDKNPIVRRGGLLFAIAALFACTSIANLVVISILGTGFQIESVPYSTIVLLQLMSSVVSFGVAALITSKYAFGSFRAVLGDQRPKLNLLLLAIAAIVVCQYFIEWASMINESLCTRFGLDYIAENESIVRLMSRIISFDGIGGWTTTIIVVGIVPALCEELYFRGALQLAFERTTHNPRYAIVASALVFALMHGQTASLIPLLLLGILLGIVFYCTRNLLINIVIHSINNILALVMISLSDAPIEQTLSSPTEATGALLPILSVIATLATVYLLMKNKRVDNSELKIEN